MRVLIVEDETAAYESLVEILKDIDRTITVLANTESITQTVNWLQTNPAPDLIFMDIHLSDGSAFLIFNTINIDVPIIFTTAYDAYAIEAFKVNSIDYLLKPMKQEEVKRAIEKFKKLSYPQIIQYLSNLTQLDSTPKFKEKILIQLKDKLIPINISDISYFYTSDKNTSLTMKNGDTYTYAKTLEQISSWLNPLKFFRANKQFIIERDSVKNITIWFDSRLLVTLNIETPERIYISKNKAAEFKEWML